MQFLKILLWCLLAFVAAIFTFGNWTWVSINLWGGLVAEVNLPFLMLLMFLAGLVPTWLYFRTQRWRLAQRLSTAERIIADLKPTPNVAVVDPPIASAAPAAPVIPVTPPPPPPPPPPSRKSSNQPPLDLEP
ncbi:hypothetical protein [Sphingomonas sp.]|jgi:hypothetical protein|uniref:hypothetical protein n=1 Tax=Sphingomonas sp. TaxID=28214 RepID=UPI002E3476B1|nr:hypothetical protein [Sphingomonas sp.]HEX4693437.1 hypothetical protein [Sphingomonas sp.]